MANLFWPSDEQWAAIKPFIPRGQTQIRAKRLLANHLGHPACPDDGLPLERLSSYVWPTHHGLQPLQSLVAARLLEGDADRAG